MSLTFGSLFASIGGMDLGLERSGMQCSWQVEIDPFARKVLAKHWPDVRRHDDVRTFPPKEGDWHVDLIAGGFPCQDISFAGKGRGSRASGPASGTSSRESFANFDPDTCSWRTSQLCLFGGWMPFSEPWPRSGMTRNGNASRRQPLALITTAIECSFAPTARAQYRGCSANRVDAGEANSNLEDWLAIRLAKHGQARGLKVNLTWLCWWMGFPSGWADMELEGDTATP